MMTTITIWLTGLCITTISSESPDEHQLEVTQRIVYNDARGEGYTYKRDLTKRAITRAAKGLFVMEKLLTGTKKVATTKNARFYYKEDNRQSAFHDFNSVKQHLIKPNVNNLNPVRSIGKVFFSSVGDRRLILMLDGDRSNKFSPVLEIRSAKDALYDKNCL